MRSSVFSILVLLGCAVDPVDDDQPLECTTGKCDGGFGEPHCFAPDVMRTSLPLFPDRPNSQRFSYAFKWFPNANPSATTVIVINGGPGATLMDQTPFGASLGAVPPSRFNIVFTDHRGSGCNQLPTGAFPEDALTTDYLAADILSIVRRLRLGSYIVFGSSYGTVLSTRVAFRAQQLGLPLPRAIVLEGAVGKSPTGFDEYVAGYDTEWQAVKSRLPGSIQRQLEADQLPLGFTSEVWGTFLQGMLVTGAFPGSPHPLVTSLAPLATGDPVGLSTLRASLEATRDALADGSLFPQVGEVLLCTELFGAARFSALQRGRLVASGPDRCGDRAFRPYDSAAFPLVSPIFYFQGSNDPAVPDRNARYHFDHQVFTSRAYVTVPAAGHGPMTLSLAALGCADAFWAAIDTQNALAFAQVAAACGTTLEGKLPGA